MVCGSVEESRIMSKNVKCGLQGQGHNYFTELKKLALGRGTADCDKSPVEIFPGERGKIEKRTLLSR
jgi:hypothetical protein